MQTLKIPSPLPGAILVMWTHRLFTFCHLLQLAVTTTQCWRKGGNVEKDPEYECCGDLEMSLWSPNSPKGRSACQFTPFQGMWTHHMCNCPAGRKRPPRPLLQAPPSHSFSALVDILSHLNVELARWHLLILSHHFITIYFSINYSPFINCLLETNTEISARYFHKFCFAHCFAHSSCKKHLLDLILQSPVAFLTDWSVTSLSWVLRTYVSCMLRSSILAWIIPGQRRLASYSLQGCKELAHELKWLSNDTCYVLTTATTLSLTHTHLDCKRKSIKMYFLCKHPSLLPLVSFPTLKCVVSTPEFLQVVCSVPVLQRQHRMRHMAVATLGRADAARHWCLHATQNPPFSTQTPHSLPRRGIWDTGFWLQLQPQRLWTTGGSNVLWSIGICS